MTLSTRRTVAVAAAVATTLTPLVALAPAQADHDLGRATDYGFAGRAYGSIARAEPLGVDSERTAVTFLACTRRPGVHHANFAAATGGEAGSSLRVTGVDNTTESYQDREQVGSRSVSTIAEAVLGDPEGMHLTIEGLRTTGTAFARLSDGRLGAGTATTSVDFTVSTGTPLDEVFNQVDGGIEEAVAALGSPLVVPGVGEISMGEDFTRVHAHKAVGRGTGVKARLYGQDGVPGGNDDVTVLLGRARAVIYDDVRSGVIRGRSVPLQSVLAGGLLNVGRVNNQPLPCPGTRGVVRESATADVDLGNAEAIEVSGLRSRVFGIQERDGARAWTEATVSDVSLGGGQVELTGIVGRVNVRTDAAGKVVTNNIRGSRIGSLVIDGEVQEPPAPGDVVEVPGLATLEFFLVDARTRGRQVTAVRITLLPGTPGESVVDLGQARTYIQRD